MSQEVDLNTLFSFDQLRESGRVNVITMEEFFEKEALTGRLGVEPSEYAKRLHTQVSIDEDCVLSARVVVCP